MLLSHSTKERLYNFSFVFVVFLLFFVFFALVMACFGIAMYDMRACNEHRVTKKYQSTFINLPYTMVVNCNTVLFEFGALSAAR